MSFVSLRTLCILGLAAARQVFAAPSRQNKSSISPITSPLWLLENLDNLDLILVDIRDSKSYASGHVPGALSIPFGSTSVWARTTGNNTLVMPPEDELFEDLGAHGLTNDKTILIIPSTAEMPTSIARATRVAATLQYAGHAISQISILDGGMEAWNRIYGPTSKSPVTLLPASYMGLVNKSFIVDRSYVRGSQNKLAEGIALIDARLSSAYAGGHIESALSIPLVDMFQTDGSFKLAADLSAMFESAVGNAPLNPARGEIIVYCWVGLMATGWHFALTNILQFGNVKLYDGSVEDWVLEYPLVPS